MAKEKDIIVPDDYLDKAMEKLMATGHYSLAEARDIAISDYIIDHGGRGDWEPTVEEERRMRKATKLVAERKKPAAPVKRERKEDFVKQTLISLLAEALEREATNIEITNKERIIAFKVGEDDFEVMLTKKRKPKK